MNYSKSIYITEPREIDVGVLGKAASDYMFIPGDVNINDNFSPDLRNLFIRTYTKIDEEVFDRLPQLSNIIRVGVGLDNIDLDLCNKKGVSVYNSAGSNSNAVAEYIVGVALMVSRKLHLVTNGDLRSWNRYKFLGNEIHTKKIGLVGFGNISRLVHQKFSALGCKDFIVYDPHISSNQLTGKGINKTEELDEVFMDSDIVSIHVPLNSETKGLVDAKRLNLMKDDAILINSSRGGIVSEKDLLNHLKKSNLSYIADVFENEPQVNEELIKNKNVVATPHIAALTGEANEQMVKRCFENYLNGKAVN